MIKTAVIYYSLTGNTRFVSKIISEELKADLIELVPEKELVKDNSSKFLWGGMKVLIKEKPELKKLDKKPEDYELLFIGTPVWAWNYTPPLRSFFNKYKLEKKKIVLFCTCMGDNVSAVFKNMKKELPNCKIISEESFIEPLKNEKSTKKRVKDWIKNIIKNYYQ